MTKKERKFAFGKAGVGELCMRIDIEQPNIIIIISISIDADREMI